ncbi:MBL fold metallo-hydrolase [Bradyrhizobium sp. HKCCYLRH1065]|uniref:MBL fold metallo-hydrolase n=1 Tax=Bradyrhizobium sp. HKCCYLRH1065 TaxID=3420753 RepID=UPI003EBC18B9
MTRMQSIQLSRRGFCLCCVSAAVAGRTGWLSPGQAFAEARNIVEGIRAEAATASIKVHRLRGNVSVLEGSGGNIAVLTGADGKLLVDAGITASRSRIAEALAALDPRPITHLINTHWHFDHADGNEWLGGKDVVILAHDNTRKHLAATQRVEDWNFSFPPLPPIALPTQTFADATSIRLNESELTLKHRPFAHTDGDLTVDFAEANILHTGDIYWNGTYPFIDYSTGGNIDGVIRAVDAILAQINEDTIVIPGHGFPRSNRSELRAYRDMLAANRDSVAALKRQGRSLEEIVAARPTAPFDAAWGQFVISPAFFTKLVHEGV